MKNFLNCGSILSIAPSKLLIGWGSRTALPVAPTYGNPAFYFPDFFLASATPWIVHEHTCVIDRDTLRQYLCCPPDIHAWSWHNPHKDFFIKTVREIKTAIQDKLLTKAVPFVFATSPQTLPTHQLHRSLFHALQYLQSHPGHLYGTWSQDEGVLGVTPETLFCLNKTPEGWSIETTALAGTVPVGQSLSSPKLLEEHQIVIEGISQALLRFGKPEISPMQTLSLPHLSHLMTPIRLSLSRSPGFIELVQALHPTPALGAFPRDAGALWLRRYQQHFNRLRFGAPVGYLDTTHQISHCVVAIRNVQWQPKNMMIGAGCGIVADSDPETEWNEVLLKLIAIKDLLDL